MSRELPALRAVQKELEEVLARHGVETFIVAWRDPDSDLYESFTHGSRFWRLGVLRYLDELEMDALRRDGEPKE